MVASFGDGDGNGHGNGHRYNLLRELGRDLARGYHREARMVEGREAMATRYGGQGRVSTKAKLADELVILGAVLANARERAGFKQLDVAARLEVPASWLSKVESGTRRLDVIELIQIAEAMELEPGELIDEIRLALLTRDSAKV